MGHPVPQLHCVGLDVGRYHDRTVLVHLVGNVLVRLQVLGHDPIPHQVQAAFFATGGADAVAVDATGPGIGMADGLALMGRPVLGVTILGRVSMPRVHIGNRTTVGQADLYMLLRREIQAGHVIVSPDCEHRHLLRQEMENLWGSFTSTGRVHFEARTGHDDMVMALALAVLARDFVLKGWEHVKGEGSSRQGPAAPAGGQGQGPGGGEALH